jgi:hypothetical protein
VKKFGLRSSVSLCEFEMRISDCLEQAEVGIKKDS